MIIKISNVERIVSDEVGKELIDAKKAIEVKVKKRAAKQDKAGEADGESGEA